MHPSQLSQIADALEIAAGTTTPANAVDEGYWLRIAAAAAAEELAGATTTANSGLFGYLKRAAVALESIAGTSGAEENENEAGYYKRIVDALEVQAGVVTSGSLGGRMTIAALAAVFGGGPAPAVVLRTSTAGDSWTDNNEAIISRSGAGTPVATDDWTRQIADSLGVTHYTTENQSSAIADGVIRSAYGGANSTTIYNNIAAIIAGDSGRVQDIWTWWSGRNDVSTPGGDNWPATTISKTNDFLALIPHERKIIMQPYGGNHSVTEDWVRAKKVVWDYRRTKRSYLLELRRYWRGLSPNGSDATVGNNDLVARDSVPQNMFASAATAQDHPNYLATPKIAAPILGVVKAMRNAEVWVLDQAIPDVARDMAQGATLEVYFKGHVTSCSITADDPTNAGLFTIAMKPASNSTALLTRTAASPGVIPAVLYLTVEAAGVDTLGVAKTHSGTVRILPSVVGAASTAPVGVTLPYGPAGVTQRYPHMATSAAIAANNAQFTFVWNGKFTTDTDMTIMAIDTLNINFQRGGGNIIVIVKDSAGTTVLSWTSSLGFPIALGNVWVAFSIQLSGTPVAHFWSYRSGVDASISPGGSPSAGTGLVNLAAPMTRFANTPGGVPNFRGSERVFWADTRLIDFSNSANRRLFWNTDGTPVDLGVDGSTGLTSAPKVYQRGATGDYISGKNFGTAGDFGFNDNWGSGYASNDPTTY